MGGLHVMLSILGFSMALPFLWMVMTSLKTADEVGSDDLLPSVWQWRNYRDVTDDSTAVALQGSVESIDASANRLTVLDADTDLPTTVDVTGPTRILADGTPTSLQQLTPGTRVGVYRDAGEGIPFLRYYWNSIFVASWVTFLQVITSSMAAFSFARLRWPGRDRVFLMYLATMMLPGLVMMIPNYQIMIRLGLVDTLMGLIIPAAFSTYGTFLMRQFMLTIPTSLDEAAEIDGAGKLRLFLDIILPLSRPGLITLTIFTFMGNYHSFFWPLVMLKNQAKYTLPIGMMYFESSRGSSTHLLMAAVTMSVVPLVLLFIVLQRYLVRGIQIGAVKG